MISDIDTFLIKIKSSEVRKSYPRASSEKRSKKHGSQWIDYFLVWPDKKGSWQPLSHAETELEAWQRAVTRVNKIINP